MARGAVASCLASCLLATTFAACKGEPPDWVGQCVQETRAAREFCECLDDRRLVRKGKIVVGAARRTQGGRYEPPVFKDLDIEDEKACRADIADRINRYVPLQ